MTNDTHTFFIFRPWLEPFSGGPPPAEVGPGEMTTPRHPEFVIVTG